MVVRLEVPKFNKVPDYRETMMVLKPYLERTRKHFIVFKVRSELGRYRSLKGTGKRTARAKLFMAPGRAVFVARDLKGKRIHAPISFHNKNSVFGGWPKRVGKVNVYSRIPTKPTRDP